MRAVKRAMAGFDVGDRVLVVSDAVFKGRRGYVKAIGGEPDKANECAEVSLDTLPEDVRVTPSGTWVTPAGSWMEKGRLRSRFGPEQLRRLDAIERLAELAR